jgi:Domain of unknown function DUF29
MRSFNPNADATVRADLYDKDYYSWALEQSRALRERRWADLDLNNLAEEVEDWGKAERSALVSYTARILEHLCKFVHWTWLLEDNSRLWQAEINAFRKAAARKLRDNPGLKGSLEILEDAWEDAKAELFRQAAGLATSSPSFERLANRGEAAYPDPCPWSFEQIMNPDFRPRPQARTRGGVKQRTAKVRRMKKAP